MESQKYWICTTKNLLSYIKIGIACLVSNNIICEVRLLENYHCFCVFENFVVLKFS